MAVVNSDGPAIDILASGAIDTERLVPDTCPIDQFPEALAHIRGGQGLKVQVAGTSD
jgi:threonine dehydrogenase-like Zn-dependent dehydrogenase